MQLAAFNMFEWWWLFGICCNKKHHDTWWLLIWLLRLVSYHMWLLIDPNCKVLLTCYKHYEHQIIHVCFEMIVSPFSSNCLRCTTFLAVRVDFSEAKQYEEFFTVFNHFDVDSNGMLEDCLFGCFLENVGKSTGPFGRWWKKLEIAFNGRFVHAIACFFDHG